MRRLLLPALFLLVVGLSPVGVVAADVDLLWRGETYVPPFYEGLPLWSRQSRVTLTAIPHGTGSAPDSLYYRWTKDGTVLGANSGIGRRSLVIPDTVLSLPIEIKVDVALDKTSEFVASASVSLTPEPARLLIVEDSPIYGLLLNREVGAELSLTESETTLAAIPLFSPVTYRNAPAMSYSWTTNSGDSREGSEVTYRAPEGASGSSSVTLKAEDAGVLAYPTVRNFLIKFGNNAEPII